RRGRGDSETSFDTVFELIFRSVFSRARLMSAAETPSIPLACLNSWGLIGRGFRDTPFPSRSAMTRNAAIRPTACRWLGSGTRVQILLMSLPTCPRSPQHNLTGGGGFEKPPRNTSLALGGL